HDMLVLEEIAKSGHVPAVGYAYVEPKEESKHEFTSTSLTFGKKKSTDEKTTVDANTRFPAASLSKIVFTYLVLQWAKENKIDLDEPLYDIVKKQIELDKPLDDVLKYGRFVDKGEYPEQAKQITIRHILSHTTGLPNLGADPHSTLTFNSKPGEKYSYSGEAFIYLQKVIEATTGKNLEELAQEYVFTPLKMDHSTFLPQREDDTKIVAVHSHLGKPTSIYESIPHLRYDLELRSSLSDLSQAEKGKIYLSENPREYYVKGMSEPAPIPLEIDLTNLTTKLNNLSFRSDILEMTSKAGHTPHLDAAGSLLTTADDFSKFMTAWLENMDDPTFKKAFEPGYHLSLMSITSFDKLDTNKLDKKPYLIKDDQGKYQIWGYKENKWQLTDIGNLEIDFEWKQDKTVFISPKDGIFNTLKKGHTLEPRSTESEEFKTCGLGWHLYRTKDTDELIAYQYGENTDMRSFVAINVNKKKGAAIFTNSEHGMSIGNQLLIGPIGNLQAVLKNLNYPQSDEPGWKEMLEGEIAEDQDRFEDARKHFNEALRLSLEGESKQRLELRLAWFNEVHPTTQEKQAFTHPLLETFVGTYKNPHEEIEISIRDDSLIHKQFGHETKLVRISDTDFVPEKNQSFLISVKEGKLSIHSIEGWEKSLDKQSSPNSQERFSEHPKNETSEAVKLESAREVNQRYRNALDNARNDTKESSATVEEGVRKDSSPSPFQTNQ
ncbi:TPA: beta-lactamase family protein, partial [Legionella pneumophila]|nr:beta-lactamase family protein [Legionella pneumophila]